ncbi:MAG: CpaF family protein [Candidatus Omnitrophota bacterium]
MLKKLKDEVREFLISKYDLAALEEKLSGHELNKFITNVIKEVAAKKEIILSPQEHAKLLNEIMDELVSLGPLKSLIEDPKVTEIMVNGPKQIYIERNGKMEVTNIKFESGQHLLYTIEKIISPSGRRVDESSPYVDFSLTDGSRVNIILPPLSLVGPVVTIRKFSPEISKVEDLVRLGSLNQKMADFLVGAIKAKLDIIFSGPTGAGKTTALNVLSSYIPDDDRIVTIEDTAELRLHQQHIVRLESRPPNIEGKGEVSIRDLFKNSLRMRPDRVIIGEIRSAEALDLLQAIESGHTGSLAIIHANSPQDVISRLEMMISLSGINLPIWMIRKHIVNAIDLIVHLEQLTDGSRKITYITEVREMKNDEIMLEDLFRFKQERIEPDEKVVGKWGATGTKPLFLSEFKRLGVGLADDIFNP